MSVALSPFVLETKFKTVLEGREDELYSNIWCIVVAESIHKVRLSEQTDVTMCASHYCRSSTILDQRENLNSS